MAARWRPTPVGRRQHAGAAIGSAVTSFGAPPYVSADDASGVGDAARERLAVYRTRHPPAP